MGQILCWFRRAPTPQPQAPLLQQQQQQQASVSQQQQKKKLRREDFILSNRKDAVVEREAGTIDGQQFVIEDCTGCDVYLLDWSATITVDYCTDCRFLIGPVEGSIFFRNCKGCDVLVICQQFRTRECQDCRFGLFCTTEPIVEMSSGLEFGCFDFCYFSLREHMSKAHLSLWDNKWYRIYDFSATAAAAAQDEDDDKPNWTFIQQSSVRGLVDASKCGALSPEEADMKSSLPVSLGTENLPYGESCVVLVLPGAENEGLIDTLVEGANKVGGVLYQTRMMICDPPKLKELFDRHSDVSAIQKGSKVNVIGIEIGGNSIHSTLQSVIQEDDALRTSKLIHLVDEAKAKPLSKEFFLQWKDDI
uniref:C-CAP/cofactor C-like domain-containing protein n=1 Tax=Vitrella brassicaformis TaxID=1169539 RepID=A0A7S1P384_9ALVE|mmetsp:Transcript_28998/g.72298  ORF Transcript_28998/g.72298 Transcript_28998/m.72298 type:complete len:362 (+) Transcript_28998:168-1253(+)